MPKSYSELEDEYNKLITSLFDKLREDIDLKQLTPNEARAVADMVRDRLNVVDHNQNDPLTVWDNSSWCVDKEWDDSGCAF